MFRIRYLAIAEYLPCSPKKTGNVKQNLTICWDINTSLNTFKKMNSEKSMFFDHNAIKPKIKKDITEEDTVTKQKRNP